MLARIKLMAFFASCPWCWQGVQGKKSPIPRFKPSLLVSPSSHQHYSVFKIHLWEMDVTSMGLRWNINRLQRVLYYYYHVHKCTGVEHTTTYTVSADYDIIRISHYTSLPQQALSLYSHISLLFPYLSKTHAEFNYCSSPFCRHFFPVISSASWGFGV